MTGRCSPHWNPSVYGKVIFLITSNTRNTYFDNNTVAFNNCSI